MARVIVGPVERGGGSVGEGVRSILRWLLTCTRVCQWRREALEETIDGLQLRAGEEG